MCDGVDVYVVCMQVTVRMCGKGSTVTKSSQFSETTKMA